MEREMGGEWRLRDASRGEFKEIKYIKEVRGRMLGMLYTSCEPPSVLGLPSNWKKYRLIFSVRLGYKF